jgi:hypothetical protein
VCESMTFRVFMADMLETRHARVLTRLRADYDDFSIALTAPCHCSECSGGAAGRVRLVLRSSASIRTVALPLEQFAAHLVTTPIASIPLCQRFRTPIRCNLHYAEIVTQHARIAQDGRF